MMLEVPNPTLLAELAGEIANLMTGRAEFEAMLDRCAATLVRHMDLALARVWIHDEGKQHLDLQASAGVSGPPDEPERHVPLGQPLIGLIGMQRAPRWLASIDAAVDLGAAAWVLREGVTSFAGQPLLAGGQLLGVVGVFSRRSLAERDVRTLESAAAILAAGVQSKQREHLQRLQAELQLKADQLAIVTEAMTVFVQTGDFRQVSARLLSGALRQTNSQYGFAGVSVEGGPHGKFLRVFADEGFDWDRVHNRELYDKVMSGYAKHGYIDFPSLDNLFGRPITEQKALISNDPLNDPRASGRRPKGHPPLHCFLGVPVFMGNEVVGTFGVANRPGGYTGEEQKRIELISQAASVIYASYRGRGRERHLEQRRSEAEEQLRKSMEELQHLAYVVSHELQEPVGKIKSYLNLLAVRYTGRLGPDADEFIHTCVSSADAVSRMGDDLWTYARAFRPEPGNTATGADRVLATALDGLRQLIQETEAEVTSDALPAISMREDALAYLFQALIRNALQYCRVEERPRVHVSATRGDGTWTFSVRDNGRGFEKLFSRDIFRLFSRLGERPGTGGTGMGLAICKRIVEQHGGSIWADSQPGVGSTFYFLIPT